MGAAWGAAFAGKLSSHAGGPEWMHLILQNGKGLVVSFRRISEKN